MTGTTISLKLLEFLSFDFLILWQVQKQKTAWQNASKSMVRIIA